MHRMNLTLSRVRLFYCTTNKLCAPINTSYALKSLQQLYKDYSDESTTIENAFNIYNEMALKTANVIIELLKLCLTLNKLDKSILIYNDILQLSQQPQEADMITAYLLFLKCCTKSDNIEINKCMDILHLIRDCPYKICGEYDLKDYSLSVNKIISKCNKNMNKINEINLLTQEIKIDDVYICTALINTYAASGDIDTALDIFNALNNTTKDSTMMNTMMKWLIKYNQHQTALIVYDEYQWLQDDISHILALKLKHLDKGHIIHQQLTADSHINLKNACIDFFGYFGDIDNALHVFNELIDDTQKDKISVGVIIKCLVNSGRYKHALEIYDKYLAFHDDKTHQFAIKACTYLDNFVKGKAIRSKITTNTDPFINATLIDFYGNFGSIFTAKKIFDYIPETKKDVAMIGAMMDAFCKSNMNFECLHLFKKYDKYKPDLICYTIALKACTQGTAYHFGMELHEKIKNTKSLQWMLCKAEIEAGFINFYGKCGELETCEKIFNSSQNKKDILLYNALINVYGKNGNCNRSKELLFECLKSGTMPDIHTYIFLINACNHSGDIKDATIIWQQAITDLDIKYNRYVMTALIDCLSRSGECIRAKELINEYEEYSNASYHYPMYMALLSGYCRSNDIVMAEEVYNKMSDIFKDNIKGLKAASILLSNIYGANSEFDKKREIRNNVGYKGFVNISEIDINGNGDVFRFRAGIGYREYDYAKGVDGKLEELVSLLKENYAFQHDYNCVTRELNVDINETKEFVLCRHSEKIALVFGLLNTSEEYQIVINRNARICNDCHNFIRLVSKLENRKFIVSDPNRVHVFVNGVCNCNEYY